MSLKAKIDVFPLEGYVLQDPSVVSVMQAVVRGNKTGAGGGVSGGGGGGSGINNESGSGSSGANKRRDNAGGGGGGGAAPMVERRLKTPLEKLMSLKARCREEQCVRSVEGVLLVHAHDHPHVLLLRHNTKALARPRILPASNTNNVVVYRLPGGRCRKGETEESCLLRKLGRDLLNEAKRPELLHVPEEDQTDTVVQVGSPHPTASAAVVSSSSSSFRVGEALARWYRPHFAPLMYPYIPAHVAESDVKEIRTIFLVHLPPQMLLTVAQRDVEFVSAPLFDLYDNVAKYGTLIASIPTLLSRVNINYCR